MNDVDIPYLVVPILAAGAATGVLSGLFGIGGGAIIVPVLYEVFRFLEVPEELRMQLCIGTSLAIIVPTTFRSWRAHAARGAVLPGVIRAWALPAAFAPGGVFKLAFAVIAAFIACKLLFGREAWRLGSELPGGMLDRLYGFVVGLCASLMGISGGSISNLVLTLYGKPLRNAVATSAGLGVPITIAGTLGYMAAGWQYQAQMPPYSIGFVSAIGVVLMAPVSSLTAVYGVRLAHWLPRRALEIGFGLFLLTASVRFLLSLLV
jgi:uncharacterized membrane protein YfcA